MTSSSTQDPDALFLPYGLHAAYGYPPYGEKGSKVITLEVWEDETAPETYVAPQWRPPPPNYGAQMILFKTQLPRMVVSGDGITAALKNPERYAQWVKETFMFIANRLQPVLTKEYPQPDETLLRVGHRDSADGGGTGGTVPRGQAPTAQQLQQTRNDQRVAAQRPRIVGDGSDQGVLL